MQTSTLDRPATGDSARKVSTADLVYFSSVSGNTHRFVQKLGRLALRIPLYAREDPLVVTEPFVLLVPTYGGGPATRAVPKQVIRFLNEEQNRKLIRGVMAAGNSNFGEGFCIAGDIIARKCQVPYLYRFEVFGTPDDVNAVREGLEKFWTQQ